jgi:hypothetical protein
MCDLSFHNYTRRILDCLFDTDNCAMGMLLKEAVCENQAVVSGNLDNPNPRKVLLGLDEELEHGSLPRARGKKMVGEAWNTLGGR